MNGEKVNFEYSAESKPITTLNGQNRPDNFGNIFLTKALFEKYFKEKC